VAFYEASFENKHFGFETPVEAILEVGGSNECKYCESEFEDFGIYDGVDSHFCESCAIMLCQEYFDDAIVSAEEECRITKDLPKFDPTYQWACTREEYEFGFRESNTENAYRTICRHQYTNYDELISGLDRDSMYDQAKYHAIRSTVEKLIESEIESMSLTGADIEEDELEEA